MTLYQKRIKVLHLIKSLGRGGAEKLIPETALVHDQSRFEFHCLYFYHQDQNIVEELIQAGIQVHLIPSGNLGLFFQVPKVREFVKQHQFDLIHAHLPWAGILARYVGKKLQIPIVYTEHNTWDRYNRVSYWGNRLTFKKQDVAIAVSNEVALSMRLNSIWDPYQRGGRLKVKVVQNGVNTEVFRRSKNQEARNENQVLSTKYQVSSIKIQESRHKKQDTRHKTLDKTNPETNSEILNHKSKIINPQSDIRNPQSEIINLTSNVSLKEQLHIPFNSPVIGKVAVFRTQKRLWLWVDLALRILEKRPDVHFLLVGAGEWRENIETKILESGKSSQFHLVGVQKAVIPFLSIMDIYLSTSEFEGLPIAMLEAMSCEVPVVATRAGGIGEVIQDGIQGFLTEIENWEELEGHCLRLLEDSELREKMAKAARQRVIERFSMVRMVRELETIYQQVDECRKA